MQKPIKMGITFSGMASPAFFVTCLLTYISAVTAECNTSLKLKFDEVGSCINGSVRIWHCQSCPHGLGHSVECGQFYNEGTRLGCVPCTAGTFSDTYDTSRCKKCKKCQKNEIKRGQCTSLKDNITCTCKPGLYRDQHTRDCKPCSWCCGDKSDEYVLECNVPQVPLGQRCSFQNRKSCAPTTPAPTAGTMSTNFSSTGTSSITSTTPITTVEKTTTTKKNENSNSENKQLVKILISIACISVAAVMILLSLLYYYKKRKESRSPNSARLVRNPDSVRSRLLPIYHNDNSNGSERGEHVVLNHLDGTAVYHRESEEPNGIHPSQDNGIRLSATRLNDDQLSFIIEKHGSKIVNLNYDIIQTICNMLNVQINGKDYRNLDTFCNMDYYEIQNLEGKENPMKYIIHIMVSYSTTLMSFLDELYKISRGDVVQKLYDLAIYKEGD